MNLVKKMNVFLANQQVFNVKLHNLHWYVKGEGFFTLHAKFEELYNEASAAVDDVAERILTLQGNPVASVKKSLELSEITELADEKISGKNAVTILQADIKLLLKASKEIAVLAAENSDNVTEGLFDDYAGAYEKLLWMLDAYLSD